MPVVSREMSSSTDAASSPPPQGQAEENCETRKVGDNSEGLNNSALNQPPQLGLLIKSLL